MTNTENVSLALLVQHLRKYIVHEKLNVTKI